MDTGKANTRVKVATDKRAIKRRIDDFLWREASEPNVRLRRVLTRLFFQFDRVAIVGGMVRDFARAGRQAFHSDVDLVIEGDVEAVARFARQHRAEPNKYGGFSFYAEGWKLDFWALETTWARRAGHASVHKLEDIAHCTFFDCDAILYDLKERRIICSDSYLDHLRSGRIEISLEPNPSVTGSLYRAVRRLLLWNLEPGPKLKSFIERHLTDQGFDRLITEEGRKDGDGLVTSFRGADVLRDCLSREDVRRTIAHGHRAIAVSGTSH
ncbi:hypothetical protein [Mesorhizobium neociceri]|uniref:Poly A polymerase head domain-containing protein n=1 Tax=Mesorhizobium neociceri TaxID=1307853 RepID=A0A838BA35_9HYPH|nr:hypothetical protein [Mesorhizobium neociceri]MBA1143466.1 hypothetical protein [Mesorhizobium neociceri]